MKSYFEFNFNRELRETKELPTMLKLASIGSARNGGKGYGITFTDFQITLLLKLVEEYIEENNL